METQHYHAKQKVRSHAGVRLAPLSIESLATSSGNLFVGLPSPATSQGAVKNSRKNTMKPIAFGKSTSRPTPLQKIIAPAAEIGFQISGSSIE